MFHLRMHSGYPWALTKVFNILYKKILSRTSVWKPILFTSRVLKHITQRSANDFYSSSEFRNDRNKIMTFHQLIKTISCDWASTKPRQTRLKQLVRIISDSDICWVGKHSITHNTFSSRRHDSVVNHIKNTFIWGKDGWVISSYTVHSTPLTSHWSIDNWVQNRKC